MLDLEKDVQGVALYAEFRKPGATMQLLVTPDGYNEEGKEVPANVYRRVVTPKTPKKQWRSSNLRVTSKMRECKDHGTTLPDYEKNKIAEKRYAIAETLFDSLLSGGWTIEKEPLFIETSKKDMTDIRLGKTPNKMLYRINQTRKAQGFPESIA
ncbi:MAG: hypothetical protein ACO38Q_02795 [Aquiluna sp.]